MKKTAYIHAAAALALSLTVSCSGDLGNYDYHDIEEIKVSGMEESYSVLVKDRLKIEPVITVENGGGYDYDFEWKVINATSQEVTVIGTEKTLDYEVTLSPDVYNLYFKVARKGSGLFWRFNCNLTVSDVYSEGWLVLCDENGKPRLDMISDVTKTTYHDILKDSGVPELKGPRKIQWLSEMTSPDSPFYLLTDDGATRLGKDNFIWKPEYDFKYEVAVNTPMKPHSIVCAGVGKMMVSEGKAYYAEVLGIDGLYGTPVNSGFNVSPYIGANLSAEAYAMVYLLYDVDNKRFMSYCPLMESSELGGYEPLVTMEEMEEIAISHKGTGAVVKTGFDEYPEGMDLLYMENTGYDPGNGKMGRTCAILSDNGKMWLYCMQMGDLLTFQDCPYVLGRSCKGDLSACTDIADPDAVFAFSSLKNYMYYAVRDKVYRVDLSSQPLRPTLQFTLPGEKVTCMKFNHFQTPVYQMKRKQYDLLLATESADGKGVLRIYEGYDSDGDFSGVVPVKFEGFAPIVDVTYRERSN